MTEQYANFNHNPNQTEDSVQIEVIKLGERKRQIIASVNIPKSVEVVWRVITDYEGLSDFIPNLAASRKLEHPSGGIRLEQIGAQRLLNFNFSARVIIDLEEHYPKEIKFSLVEGDLKEYHGSWLLQPYTHSCGSGTKLCYTVCVVPKRIMPVNIIERRLSQDLQVNLLAIKQKLDSYSS